MNNCISAVRNTVLATGLVSSAMLIPATYAATKPLSLNQAVNAALAADVWQQGNELQRQAHLEEGAASGTLPDLRINLSAANLPVDTFNFNQEGMTQLKVGVSQMFPRGNTLELKKQRGIKSSELNEIAAQTRSAQVTVAVSTLFLDAWLAQQNAALIEQNRSLFEQLVDITEKSYESAWGKAQQQDVIRAELELSRLEERLNSVWQGFDNSYQLLAEWLPLSAGNGSLSTTLPNISPLKQLQRGDWNELSSTLVKHPLVKSIDQKRAIADTDVELAKQSYKPEWGLNASYGYRGDDPIGNSRSDFLSVGVSFDLPVFTDARQDKQVDAAIYRAQAVETERQLLLRKLRAEFEATTAQIERLDQRNALYQSQLLEQTRQQSESALNAYTAGIGDFAEVMRAHIAELNTRIEAQQIQVQRLKKIIQLNYLLVGEII